MLIQRYLLNIIKQKKQYQIQFNFQKKKNYTWHFPSIFCWENCQCVCRVQQHTSWVKQSWS